MEPLGRKLLEIAHTAIAACHGEKLCARVAKEMKGPVELVGSGKAAVAMARGVIEALEVRSGVLCTKDEPGFAPQHVEIRRADHPLPDPRSAAAARAIERKLMSAKHPVVAVISGGTSSLLATPGEGLAVPELRRAYEVLLNAGLRIEEINIVRKHITRWFGGRLARVSRQPIDVLVISDVLGDDITAIGSGPFAPDPSSFEQALGIARSVSEMPRQVLSLLERGARGEIEETPKPGDACFERVRHHMVASHATLIDAAVEAASAEFRVRRLPSSEDSVADVAERYARERLEPGEILVSGGEPRVKLPPDPGRGGRNQQLALHMARVLFARREPACFLAIGSDGSDGPTDAAGALVDERSWATMPDPEAALVRADAYPILDSAYALVRTGATGTNVLDLHLLARA
ncbi:MAG TPA: DUF4147 domain-containing protein [Polyangiaceae bacterium]|nr:DUF4147 domain-containing protein [Polyangiaceae bacterium]